MSLYMGGNDKSIILKNVQVLLFTYNDDSIRD